MNKSSTNLLYLWLDRTIQDHPHMMHATKHILVVSNQHWGWGHKARHLRRHDHGVEVEQLLRPMTGRRVPHGRVVPRHGVKPQQHGYEHLRELGLLTLIAVDGIHSPLLPEQPLQPRRLGVSCAHGRDVPSDLVPAEGRLYLGGGGPSSRAPSSGRDVMGICSVALGTAGLWTSLGLESTTAKTNWEVEP